ncbi:hypothetical protein JCM19240_2571 [Vibrio maritimus]|uniref:DUF3080 domain-containing protein n=1 Tax=Vibrio maritimus TaxID=990268 RepID=A0A090U0F0_9VIBR|nr:hypothetical protein JCM19240_2571 [Vibrio maritimus]
MFMKEMTLSIKVINTHFLLLFFALTTGCFSHSPKDRFLDYQQRIANVQQSELLPSPSISLVELPAKRELTKEIPRTTLGLVDSYQLRKCNLFGLIAERNSVLGKVQDQFRNFDYQLQLIDGLERCLTSNQIEPELKESLEQILDIKYQYLPDYFFNLVYTSDAMRMQLSGADWIIMRDASLALQIKEPLKAFNDVAKFIASRERATLERPPLLTGYQEILEKQNVIGRLAFSLEASQLWLQTITTQLNQYDDNIPCGKNRNMERFNYLVNVFNNVFVKEVQPYLSYLDSEYQALSAQTHFVSDLLTTYKENSDSLERRHLAFKQANRAHVTIGSVFLNVVVAAFLRWLCNSDHLSHSFSRIR